MFENKKFKALFIAEAVLPWVVSVLGGITIAFYSAAEKYYAEGLDEKYRRVSDICIFFYNCSMGYGMGLCAVLSIVGVISLVIMLTQLFGEKKEQKYSAAKTIFLWSALCVLGTFVLMVLVLTFTYGQGV